ncbi:hypothetical protein AKO1_001461 [Acrasis kona]|uniref:BRCT domain-containing protein n=1 Tax=Acrasis kona TaxID=1008807 RepID=A0AAW2Z9L0_9EUKA
MKALFDKQTCYMCRSVPDSTRHAWENGGGVIITSPHLVTKECKYYFCDDPTSLGATHAANIIQQNLGSTNCFAWIKSQWIIDSVNDSTLLNMGTFIQKPSHNINIDYIPNNSRLLRELSASTLEDIDSMFVPFDQNDETRYIIHNQTSNK